jgi:hypothetical protein
MTVCVIMHNMIAENERDDNIYDKGWDFQGELAGRGGILGAVHACHQKFA